MDKMKTKNFAIVLYWHTPDFLDPVGYNCLDYFESDTLDRAEHADTIVEADEIMRSDYKGVDEHDIGVQWGIFKDRYSAYVDG